MTRRRSFLTALAVPALLVVGLASGAESPRSAPTADASELVLPPIAAASL